MDIKVYKKVKRLINKLYTLEKIANYNDQSKLSKDKSFRPINKTELLAQKLYTKLRCYTGDEEELVSLDQKLWDKMLYSKKFNYASVSKMKEKIRNRIYTELSSNQTVPSAIKKFVYAKFNASGFHSESERNTVSSSVVHGV